MFPAFYSDQLRHWLREKHGGRAEEVAEYFRHGDPAADAALADLMQMDARGRDGSV